MHRCEFKTSSFERSFRLDREFDEEAFTADFANGILTIRLPKKVPEAEPVRKIKIGS